MTDLEHPPFDRPYRPPPPPLPPPPAPASPRAPARAAVAVTDPAPRRLVAFALAVGLVLEIGLRGGADNLIVAAGVLLLVAALLADGRVQRSEARKLALAALAPAAFLAVRASPWLMWSNLALAGALLGAAVLYSRSGSVFDASAGAAAAAGPGRLRAGGHGADHRAGRRAPAVGPGSAPGAAGRVGAAGERPGAGGAGRAAGVGGRGVRLAPHPGRRPGSARRPHRPRAGDRPGRARPGRGGVGPARRPRPDRRVRRRRGGDDAGAGRARARDVRGVAARGPDRGRRAAGGGGGAHPRGVRPQRVLPAVLGDGRAPAVPGRGAGAGRSRRPRPPGGPGAGCRGPAAGARAGGGEPAPDVRCTTRRSASRCCASGWWAPRSGWERC